MTLDHVNGSPVTFPYTIQSSVTTIGGSCGTAVGDSSTVNVSITGTASQSGTATCSTGSFTYTTSPALSASGPYTVTATQADSFTNVGSSGAQTLTLDITRPTTTALSSNHNPSVYGDSVTFTATVSAAAGDPGANGSVTFKDGGVAIAGCSSVALDVNSQATCTTSALHAVDSPHSITAEYSGAIAAHTWDPSTSSPLSQVVTKKALTVTGITASTKVYDRTTSATIDKTGATLVGVVGTDSVTLDTTAASGAFLTASAGTLKTVQISGLTFSGADSGNYTLTQPSTTADITAARLTVSATGVPKVYDGTAAATVNLTDDRIGGDVFTDSYTSATFDAGKDVGHGQGHQRQRHQHQRRRRGQLHLTNTTRHRQRRHHQARPDGLGHRRRQGL